MLSMLVGSSVTPLVAFSVPIPSIPGLRCPSVNEGSGDRAPARDGVTRGVRDRARTGDLSVEVEALKADLASTGRGESTVRRKR